jgi:pimeloyl-ACP methyl ester carboxylesterase
MVFKKYWDKGNGIPVIFIHGDAQNHTVFLKLVEYFSERDHGILLFDLPGHGLSKMENKNPLEIIKEIIGEHNLKNPILIGHSSGGILAKEYAIETKNASALVLINTTLTGLKGLFPNWRELMESYLEYADKIFAYQECIDYSINNLTEERIKEISLKSTPPEALRKMIDWYISLENKQIKEIEIPILLINSEGDPYTSYEKPEDIIANNKNIRLVKVPGRHNAHITNSQEIIKELEQNYSFLTGKAWYVA